MEKFISLLNIKEGEKTAVYKVDEIDKKLNRRLIELGFVKGEKIYVLKNNNKSETMLIGLRGYTLCIDYVVAKKVIVWAV